MIYISIYECNLFVLLYTCYSHFQASVKDSMSTRQKKTDKGCINLKCFILTQN